MIDPTILDTIGGAGVGAAVGFGTFVGYVRANMRAMREVLCRVENKIDQMDKKIDDHTVSITRLETQRTVAPDPCRGCGRGAPDSSVPQA